MKTLSFVIYREREHLWIIYRDKHTSTCNSDIQLLGKEESGTWSMPLIDIFYPSSNRKGRVRDMAMPLIYIFYPSSVRKGRVRDMAYAPDLQSGTWPTPLIYQTVGPTSMGLDSPVCRDYSYSTDICYSNVNNMTTVHWNIKRWSQSFSHAGRPTAHPSLF